MKISIITVCYNSAATLEETLKSVLSQTHPNVEYIVIDGASTDGSQEIVAKYIDRIAHFISEPDKGIYEAMNKGIALATGDIIGILNSDDLYKNEKVLDNVAKSFTPKIQCVCTDVEIFKDHPGNVIRYYSCTRWKAWMFRIGHQPPHPGFFVRRECYTKFGTFNTRFKLAADFDILLRLIFKEKCTTIFCPWVSVSMRSGGASQKGLANISRANREVNASLKQNGYFSIGLLIWMKYLVKVFQFGRS